MNSHGARLVVVSALLCALGTGAAAPTPPARPQEAHVRTSVAQLQKKGKRVRDWDTFRTERGEPAVLVLYVTDAVEPPADFKLDDPLSCPEANEGVPLAGRYHLALFIGGQAINEIDIPDADAWSDHRLHLPLRNLHVYNNESWGQGAKVEYDDPAANVEEATKLMRLVDINGDGHAWEQRIVQDGGACGHLQSLLAGYSAKQRKVILYPIVAGASAAYWHDNFFPMPSTGARTHVHYVFPCGDHGVELLSESEYDYNAAIEAWVQTSESTHSCFGNAIGAGAAAAPPDREVVVHVGSARGRPGETVDVAVTIDPNGVDVSDVEIDLPSDNLAFDSCSRAGGTRSFTDIRVGHWGVHALLAELGRAADDELARAPLANGTLLFTCKLSLPAEDTPALYRLTLSGLRVRSDDSAHPQSTRATSGEIAVLPPL